MRRRRGSERATVMALVFGLALLLAPFLAPSAQAAPATQGCQVGAFFQFDLSGVYVSQASLMRVELFPCGGAYVQWDNEYGTHAASYYSTNRLPGGGVAASRMSTSYEALDATNRIGFKPAEPGFIQVITVSDYGGVMGIYRLQKIT